ncbi:MAG: GDSL-type esterase/lipase family protein [Tepidisphaeraceae bacterium]
MKLVVCLTIAAAFVAAPLTPLFAQPAAPASTRPTSRPADDRARANNQDPAVPDQKWLVNGQPQPRFVQKHQEFLDRAKQGPVDLLFLGDSITEGWISKAPGVFNDAFGKYATANFGISGDRTQHVLWRIANGELDAIKPKLIVLMIGTNNQNLPAADIARGVTAVVDAIRVKQPEAKVLLLAIFPRSEKPDDAVRVKLNTVNESLAKLDDASHVFYLDIGKVFLEADGTLPKSIMPDGLHPNKEGYERWAKAIGPKVEELMK